MAEFEMRANTTCLVCCNDDLPRHRGIVPCDHNDVCGQCHIRLRFLHQDNRCSICKTSNERVIVDNDDDHNNNNYNDNDNDNDNDHANNETGVGFRKNYNEYSLWGDNELGQDFMYREDLRMFFRQEYHDAEVSPLFLLSCQVPSCPYVSEKGVKGLSTHLKAKHNLSLCHLCVEAKRDFVSRLPRLKPDRLKKHLSKGEGKGSGFTGHPLCEFCKPKRFYDLTKLHEHLNKDHYKCHVCERQGLHNQFFKNYEKLALHFDRQHFLCPDPQCLAARFVVFENEIDLRTHERSVHGGSLSSNTSTKIQLEFRVRRTGYVEEENQTVPTQDDFQYGLNGEAFVPEALPGQQQQQQQQQQQNQERFQQEREPEITDALHAERTAAIRAQAAEIRRLNNQPQEEFPDLMAATATNGELTTTTTTTNAAAAVPTDGMSIRRTGSHHQPSLTVGWTSGASRNIGRNRSLINEDNFPSLSSRPKPSNTFLVRKMTPKKSNGAMPITTMYANVGSTPVNGNYPSGAVSTPASIPTPVPAPAPSLTSQDFPSLGNASSSSVGRTKSQNYAQLVKQPAITKKNQQTAFSLSTNNNAKKPPPPAVPTMADFPSLHPSQSSLSPVVNSKRNPLARPSTMRPQSAVPTASDFPSFASGPSSSSRQKNHHVDNIKLSRYMLLPTPVSKMAPQEQIAALKSILGSQYKRFKSLTKDFSMDQIAHEQYIDAVAETFPEGKDDPDFWKYVPCILDSCPDDGQGRIDRAMIYLAKIRIEDENQFLSHDTTQNSTPSVAAYPTNHFAQQSTAGTTTKKVWGSANGKNNILSNKQNLPNTEQQRTGGVKKNKGKKKNNELKQMAFGM